MAAYQMPYDDQDETGLEALTTAGGSVPFLNVVTPGLSALAASQKRQRAEQAALANANALEGPRFTGDYGQIAYAGDYNPQMYSSPEAAQYQLANEDPAARGVMLSALERMAGEGTASAEARARAARYGALSAADQMAGGREGAIRAEMQRRGKGGGGLEAVLRAQSAQSSANRAAEGGLNAESALALERLANTEAQFGAAGQLRGQDYQKAMQNAEIANRFNAFNTQARNARMAANTELANQAQMRNIGTKQGLQGMNTGIRNEGINRGDRNVMSRYGADIEKLNQVNSVLMGQGRSAIENNQNSRAAGAEGFKNFKTVMAGMAGGMGGTGGEAYGSGQPMDWTKWMQG